MKKLTLAIAWTLLVSCAGTSNPKTYACEEGCRAELITCKQTCPSQDSKPAEYDRCVDRCQGSFDGCAKGC